MKTSKQIFEFFPGIWKLSRQTSSTLKNWPGNVTGEAIKAEGYAAFSSSDTDKNCLIYSEKVTVFNMNFGIGNTDQGMEARQRYHYKYDEDTLTLTKYFTDGRLFYNLNITETDDASTTATKTSSTTVTSDNMLVKKIGGEHLCIQDNYVSDYKFGVGDKGQRVFTLMYSVNGPKKCYDIHTEFEQLEDDAVKALGIQVENGDIL